MALAFGRASQLSHTTIILFCFGTWKDMLMVRRLLCVAILIFASTQVFADIAPPPPQPPPPPPPGPAAAVIRGLSVERAYDEWLGSRWFVVIKNCAASRSTCGDLKLTGCFVVGANGHQIQGGDVAALLAADVAAGAAPMKLMLENCDDQSELVLPQ
jgi:hypothetical protein